MPRGDGTGLTLLKHREGILNYFPHRRTSASVKKESPFQLLQLKLFTLTQMLATNNPLNTVVPLLIFIKTTHFA
ncbi:MAG: hypothetical protein BA862_10905 [Desulfobulbaceae bacterium S3730MH12]|nr:MAG: hypothetical protein BA862_10905 [Desulfobulbaceae bacterium S3730MH12]OEU78930.1 MAG: hypothetical protein BA873_11880 [Desulfobulbaceae bacterium C00003063]